MSLIETFVQTAWQLSGAEQHSPAHKCPTCGKFSSGSWVSTVRTPYGPEHYVGGKCATHGEWIDQAAETGWLRNG